MHSSSAAIAAVATLLLVAQVAVVAVVAKSITTGILVVQDSPKSGFEIERRPTADMMPRTMEKEKEIRETLRIVVFRDSKAAGHSHPQGKPSDLVK